jgi:hypothetical protein
MFYINIKAKIKFIHKSTLQTYPCPTDGGKPIRPLTTAAPAATSKDCFNRSSSLGRQVHQQYREEMTIRRHRVIPTQVATAITSRSDGSKIFAITVDTALRNKGIYIFYKKLQIDVLI